MRLSLGACMPIRIQLSRKIGWRKPENTVVVSRPTKWGNPFKVISETSIAHSRAGVVELYRDWLENLGGPKAEIIMRDIEKLRGKNLACWCPLDQPCHADVLLELANQPRT
jgi:hypothetical protein